MKDAPSRPTVLVIEDDDTLASEISRELSTRGFKVDRTADGADGYRMAAKGEYSVITLDRMLPSLDGLTIAALLKEAGVQTPILMLSAMSDVDERIKGLRAGGDDYLAKPFALEEMSARVEVLLRRTRADRDHVLRYADVELDLLAHVGRRAGKDLHLYPKEVKLLEIFLRNPEQLLTRTMIFEKVWGYNFDPGTNIIDVHVGNLRRKLEYGGAPALIRTARRAGYILNVTP
jgi:two-component system OmpR family response regulator